MSSEPAPGDDELRRTVQELILGILNKKKVQIGLDGIKEGVSLSRDLGIDSLDILQLIAVVEKKYGLKVPEAELKTMDDLGVILATVKKQLPARS